MKTNEMCNFFCNEMFFKFMSRFRYEFNTHHITYRFRDSTTRMSISHIITF